MKPSRSDTPSLTYSSPQRPWQVVTMDFVIGLPLYKGFNAILVVVDHLPEMRHLIPGDQSAGAQDIARMYPHHVWKHGLLTNIVSDRGPSSPPPYSPPSAAGCGYPCACPPPSTLRPTSRLREPTRSWSNSCAPTSSINKRLGLAPQHGRVHHQQPPLGNHHSLTIYSQSGI